MIFMNDVNDIVWIVEIVIKGFMKMFEVFNYGIGVVVNYNIIFVIFKKDGNKDVVVVVVGDKILEVVKDYINNLVKYIIIVVYNYGKIFLVKNFEGGYDDVIREVERFEIIYNCIYNSIYIWVWVICE